MYRLTPFSWSADTQLMVTQWLLTHRHSPLPHLLIHSFFPQVFTTWWWQPLSQSTQQLPNNLCMLDTDVRTLKFTICTHKTHTKNVKWPLSSEAEISAKGPGCGESSMPQRQTWVDWKPRANKYRIEVNHSGDLHSGPQMRSRGCLVTCGMFRCALHHQASLTNFLSQLYKKIKFKNFSLHFFFLTRSIFFLSWHFWGEMTSQF